MKSALLLYFSGTGNTEIVAKTLQQELITRQYATDLIRMEDVLKGKAAFDASKYDLIGIGCQVIGFAAPSLVYQFIKTLPKTEAKRTFIFRTAGGVAPINYNASKPMIRKLKRKGYQVFYERIFSLSSNWISKFDDDVIVQLYDATCKKVALMADELDRNETRVLKTGFGQKMLMECVMAVTPMLFRLVGKDYAVNNACTHCGLCVRNCPASNIVEKNGKIKFKLSCNCCLRCVYACPQNAIRLRAFSFFTVPSGYNIKRILSQPQACDREKKKQAPKFFDAYLKDESL